MSEEELRIASGLRPLHHCPPKLLAVAVHDFASHHDSHAPCRLAFLVLPDLNGFAWFENDSVFDSAAGLEPRPANQRFPEGSCEHNCRSAQPIRNLSQGLRTAREAAVTRQANGSADPASIRGAIPECFHCSSNASQPRRPVYGVDPEGHSGVARSKHSKLSYTSKPACILYQP